MIWSKTIHLNEFQYELWYNATYLINASKVWLLCIVHINQSINGKKRFHVKKTVHAER